VTGQTPSIAHYITSFLVFQTQILHLVRSFSSALVVGAAAARFFGFVYPLLCRTLLATP
jgi:hypothetical protein